MTYLGGMTRRDAEPPRRCALYLRVSLDTTGKQLAVSRQRKECTEIAQARGWTIVEEFVDNSVSASKSDVKRPGYDAMVAAFSRGEFDALLCWDLDRLSRQPRQLEDWIDAAETRGLLLATANGEADLSTDGGRLFARVKLAVARSEVERKSARQKAAHIQRAADGRPWGTTRSFGFQSGTMEHHLDEAPVLRWMYDELLAGTTQAEIARQLNARGIRTTRGKEWIQTSVRSVLIHPRNAGFRVRKPHDEHRKVEECIVAKGQWEPIVTEETWRAAVDKMTANPRPGGGHRKYLLSGLARCGVCGTTVRGGYSAGGYNIYMCTGSRCVGRNLSKLDELIVDTVLLRLAQPDAQQLIVRDDSEDVEELRREASDASEALDALAAMYGAGKMKLSAFQAGTQAAQQRLEAAHDRMVDYGRAERLGNLVGAQDIRAAWEGLDLERRRGVVDALMTIHINPVGRGKRFDPESIRIDWKVG